jgi:hypothetical protein
LHARIHEASERPRIALLGAGSPGGRLLAHAVDGARAMGGAAIWLTTYAHLPFNRPYYLRHGYEVVPEAACGADVRHHLDEQRRYLPEPASRVAMRRLL